MSDAEMNVKKRVDDSLTRKIQKHFAQNEIEVEIRSNVFSTYEEAKQAGNVREMIGFKKEAFDERVGTAGVIKLSNEYYSTLGISEIQKRLSVAESNMKKSKDAMDRMFDNEVEKLTKEYRKIGGLQDKEVARGKAIEAVDVWKLTDDEFLRLKGEYLECKKEFLALKNAKDMYIEDNKELIEYEKQRAKREELLASGILEELGIKVSKSEVEL